MRTISWRNPFFPGPTSHPATPASMETINGAAESRRPGVMLFSRADRADQAHPARDSLMVVFTVGETPTGGVDPAAMRSALDQVAWLRGWIGAGGSPAPAHLVELPARSPAKSRFIGPSYSGSATSIKQILRAWIPASRIAQPAPHIALLSGTATAIESWPAELAIFIQPSCPKARRIVESLTSFKRSSDIRASRYSPTTPTTATRSPSYISGKLRTSTLSGRSRCCPIQFISRTSARPSRALLNRRLPRRRRWASSIAIRRYPTGPGQDRYLVPSFSRATAADDEVVLANLLSTIHRENFHYVGIVATNIQDAIFLVRQIRENCPDTIPFLTTADLLYLHSDFNRDLTGTLGLLDLPFVCFQSALDLALESGLPAISVSQRRNRGGVQCDPRGTGRS